MNTRERIAALRLIENMEQNPTVARELDIKIVERKEPTLMNKLKRIIGFSKKTSVRTYR